MSTPHTAEPGRAQQPVAARVPLVCPACSALARRTNAHFCATCGRGLQTVEYLPTDTLRASYHHQYYHPPLMPGHAPHRSCVMRPAPRPLARDPRTGPQDGVLLIARTLVAYALIPYLGILFCPCAIIMGSMAWWSARRTPQCGNPRAAVRYIILAVVIFYAQTYLWRFLF